jgi:hypothetical protein
MISSRRFLGSIAVARALAASVSRLNAAEVPLAGGEAGHVIAILALRRR